MTNGIYFCSNLLVFWRITSNNPLVVTGWPAVNQKHPTHARRTEANTNTSATRHSRSSWTSNRCYGKPMRDSSATHYEAHSFLFEEKVENAHTIIILWQWMPWKCKKSINTFVKSARHTSERIKANFIVIALFDIQNDLINWIDSKPFIDYWLCAKNGTT